VIDLEDLAGKLDHARGLLLSPICGVTFAIMDAADDRFCVMAAVSPVVEIARIPWGASLERHVPSGRMGLWDAITCQTYKPF